ncbi:DUF5979 domain-containing protein [Isoptericola sp. F-RaC21]|uniref:DUF5979 domain-containing protein n=1 Tax=Isoptericola sp. F-RaC21 TaxID=3141452 RepID=UPI00315B9A7F
MVDGRKTAGERQRQRARLRARRRVRRGASVLGALALAFVGVIIPATSASAATWGITKTVETPGPYTPGQRVTYEVQISCSDASTPCQGTVFTDELPDGLELIDAEIVSQPSGTNGELTEDTDGDVVSARWPSFTNGQQATIEITVQIDPDLPFSADGVPIVNTAEVVADNAAEDTADASITPEVELALDSETTKTIDPEGALAAPGTAATVTIGGTNTSNDTVDSLVLTEPSDPAADPNPFTYLGFTGFGPDGDGSGVSWPAGATGADVAFTCADGSTPTASSTTPDTLPNPPEDCVVEGFTVTFTGDIEQGASADIPFSVEQTEAVEGLDDTATVTNEVASHVTHGDEESAPTTDSDTYVITPPNNSVTASKSFDPDTVSAGDPTTVTLGGTNTGTAVDSMTIVEPAPGTDSPFTGPDAITFTGFGPDSDGTGVQWPNGASGASVTFTCADGSTPTLEATTPNTLPNPPADCVVEGFTVTFTGNLPTGAEASIPFTADTDPDQTEDDVTHDNTVEADVPNADAATANDQLVTLNDRLATATTKNISPSTIPAVPGQGVIVQLPSQLAGFGQDGSTTNADQVVISDPTDPNAADDFWDHFAATGVRSTDVPANSTLTVNYWDGNSWEPAPGCGPYTGPATVSCDLPAGAEGVQFVYDSTGDGFPPGTQFQPNFTADFTGPEDWDAELTNCGASSASSGTVDPTEPAEGCDTVDPYPVDGDGPGDFIDKTFLEGDPPSVLARSDGQVTGQITWSTGGFSGVNPMVISDIQNPETTDIADSFYDAFDLIRVEAIDSSVDPLIQYDAVTGVELFIDGAWVDATNTPCTEAAPCAGSFPGYTLTEDEQESATSVRLTYTENPNRTATPSDPTAPAAGDGVARSTQDDGRHLDLTFQVRDYKRSDGSPALGSTKGTIYNLPDDPGMVRNTAEGTATYDGGEFTDSDFDDVLIIDQPLNVGVTKEWSGGAISVPPDGTEPQFYPSTTVTVTGTNESAAKVDQLRLVDPADQGSGDVQTAEGTHPFDTFTLTEIALTPPAGATSTTVTLTYEGGDTATFTEEQAEALTAADLATVVGIETSYDGLVEAGASGSMELTLQLRAADRYTGEPIDGGDGEIVVDENPVPNGAAATIADPGGVEGDTRLANDDADMQLQTADISLDVTKSFSPDTVVEPNHGADADDTPVTMTISGTPQGPSRSVEMVLTDDEPQFWNQYDFVGFEGAALTAPIQLVQVDAYTGGTFTGDDDGVTVTGGEWKTGTPSSTFTLPDGVEPGDVQGLRFTFSREDGSIWENPATPTQEVPIQILRRDELRTGGPVLPDLEANAPAPGETDPGVASNTVTGTTTGADLVVDPDTGELVPVSDDDSADASMLYQHATNGVEIAKDFDGKVSGGIKAPNAVFPMNIEVTNAGDRPITDPVILDDPMPTDDDGAQLRLADVDEPFSYALAGDDPDTDTPNLPTDAGDVTVDQTGDLEGLRFTFPEGSVLEPNQTYTVTVMVMFRVGLPPDTVVSNTAGVTGDRPWDECSPTLDEESGACEATADVRPSESAALSQSKRVKATENDELEVFVDPAADPGTTCTPDEDGFYGYPCTPVVPPGHDETWRIRIDNVGNDPITKLVTYDRIPAPGDTGSYDTDPRGSAWRPYLSAERLPAFRDLPPGVEGRLYYSTSADYCMDDIEDPLNEPICPTDDPETGWVRLTPGLTDDEYAAIRAIKIVATFPDDRPMMPGDFVTVDKTTTTPPTAPAAGDRSIAYNSAAAAAAYERADGSMRNLLPTEGQKVGVATATGSLNVVKFAGGPGEEYAPDEFQLNVQCTSAVGTWVERELDPIPITVPNGGAVTVDDLPYGAECTITEDDGVNGETELFVGTVTIGEEPDTVGITAVNWYELGSLELSKDVVSDAVDQDGNAIAYGPFEATVECTFLGEDVYADGYSADDPMVVELAGDGTPVTLSGLPVNADCTVTESDTANAASTTITVTQPGEDPVETDGTSADVTIVPDDEGTAGTQIGIANTFDVGAINLQKVVEGEGGDAYGTGPFHMQVVCTYDADGDGPGEAGTVYDGEVVLGGAGPLEAQVSNLPVGADCQVTETDDGGATGSVVVPDTVTVDADEVAQVVITNTFDVGTVEVDKELDGLGALYGPGPFEVTLECTYGEDADGDPVTIAIPGGAVRTFVPGQPATYEGLPVGAECTVTETDDFGATETSVSVDGGDPVDGNTADVVVPPADDGAATAVTVTVTNTFLTSPLLVQKVVDGDGANFAPTMPEIPPLPDLPEDPVSQDELDELIAQLEDYYAQFPLENVPYQASLECTFQGAQIQIPGGATRPFGPGLPGVYFGLPDGAVCTVTETEDGGATSVTLEPNPIEIEETDLPADPLTVTATNTYDTGSIEVEKVLDGPAAEFVTAPFEVSLACTFEGQEIEVPGGATRTVTPDEPATYDGLPVGAECVVTETDAAGAASTTVSTTVDGGDPGQVVVPGADDDPATITVTNTFDVGEVSVYKAVDGDGAAFGTGPFEVSLECTFQGEPIDVPGGATRELSPDGMVVYDGLPVGADCVVTETDAGGATSSTVSTAVEDGDPGQVVVPAADADPATITVTNTFDVGSVAVTKKVDFEGDSYDVGPFEVTLACTFQGEDITVPGGAAREIAAGDTVTYAGLPIGAECVVTETDDGGAASSTVSTVGDPSTGSGESGDPGAVTIAADAASVTVTNTFDAVPPPPSGGGTGDNGGGDNGTGDNGGGWLPTTGADIALWVGLAVLLVAGGIVLVGIRRRHQQ